MISQETFIQLSKYNDAENSDVKDLKLKLEKLQSETVEFDLDLNIEVLGEDTIQNVKDQMEQVKKGMQDKQLFHDNLKREIERQHKAKKKTLSEKYYATTAAKPSTAPKRSSPGPTGPPGVNSKKFRAEVMPEKSVLKEFKASKLPLKAPTSKLPMKAPASKLPMKAPASKFPMNPPASKPPMKAQASKPTTKEAVSPSKPKVVIFIFNPFYNFNIF